MLIAAIIIIVLTLYELLNYVPPATDTRVFKFTSSVWTIPGSTGDEIRYKVVSWLFYGGWILSTFIFIKIFELVSTHKRAVWKDERP